MHHTNPGLAHKRTALVLVLSLSCIVTSVRSFSQLRYGNTPSPREPLTEESAAGSTATGMTATPVHYLPLSIGDRMPDISFKMLNYPTPTARISDFKGKLIILDFWATWCGSCISKFPKLDSIQEKFKDQVQVILVNSTNTGDNEEKIYNFFKRLKRSSGNSYLLPTAIEDNLADILFPHRELPHYAWINEEGRVSAITSSHEITIENVSNILNKVSLSLPRKEDFFPDKLMNLGLGEISIDDKPASYSIFKKGKLEGLGYINQLRVLPDGTKGEMNIRGKAMRNVSLLEMFKEAISANQQIEGWNIEKLLYVCTDNADKLEFDSCHCSKDQWEKENLYTYDLVIPKNQSDSLYKYMIDDLNRYSDFHGRFEKRKVKCLALIRTSNSDKIKTKGYKPEYCLYNEQPNKYIQNLPIDRIVYKLDHLKSILLPVVDQTGYTANVDIVFQGNIESLNDVRRSLRQYDLDIIEKEKELNVFIISDKK